MSAPSDQECPRQLWLSYKLEIIRGNRILVPGCEPTSAISTDTLARFDSCGQATVALADALEAIPGSYIEYQTNFGVHSGGRKRWYVLPPWCQDDVLLPDYYEMLKVIASEPEEDEQPRHREAEIIYDFGPPDPDAAVIKPKDTYGDEGEYYGIIVQKAVYSIGNLPYMDED